MLKLGGWEPLARSTLRIVAGFTFSLHGFQKLLGLFGGMGGRGATAPLFSLMWTKSTRPSRCGEYDVGGGWLTLSPAFFPGHGRRAVLF